MSSYTRGNFPEIIFPRGNISGDNFPGGNLPGGNLVGGDLPRGNLVGAEGAISLVPSTASNPLLLVGIYLSLLFTGQKTKFSIKDFFSKCDQTCEKLRTWSHLVKKSLMENSNFVQCFEYNTLAISHEN